MKNSSIAEHCPLTKRNECAITIYNRFNLSFNQHDVTALRNPVLEERGQQW